MPDGDIVHNSLGWRYQKVYKEVCDGQYRESDLAEEVIRAVCKDIQDAGNQIIEFLQQVGEQCQQILGRRMFEQINWQKESAQVDELARPIRANRRFKTLAVDACKELLQDLRNGGNASKCHIDLVQKYIWNVYVAQFLEKVPLTPAHYQEASRESIGERLALMKPCVQERLQPYAEKVCRQGTIAQLPRRRSTTKRNYNIDTDLSTVGA